ncbi:phospholipase A1-II 1-like [Magnolia sinica]|uniref:phospholipase A1-II 1-like n=1 Tax=Magnolia sinica TaxID=86752 RepID=UPI002657AE62|nr:phospholipase A1-II 1-like [Magnolia sinica]
MAGNIAHRWEEISGKDNWNNLLDPLDLDLRRSILNYGNLNEAVGDAFNDVKVSKNYGTSRYSKANLFDRVGLVKGNPFKYEVTKFFYATSEIDLPEILFVSNSSWIGYVAVATDEGKVALGRRDIVISWRGTRLDSEWINDITVNMVSASEILGNASTGGGAKDPKVHEGFLSIYTSTDPESSYSKTSAREQVLTEVRRLVEIYKNEEISITVVGHSMGAAVATINAADIVGNGANKVNDISGKACPVTAIVFACPLVGDSDFKLAFSSMNDLRLLRVRNVPDIVPGLPIFGFVNNNLLKPIRYVEVGVELSFDSRDSNYLKSTDKSWHNLEVYLHGVAGTQGSKGGFELEVNRDINLVNKGTDALKDDYSIPSSWWIEKNKGMVQHDDGTWHLDDREEDTPDV